MFNKNENNLFYNILLKVKCLQQRRFFYDYKLTRLNNLK